VTTSSTCGARAASSAAQRDRARGERERHQLDEVLAEPLFEPQRGRLWEQAKVNASQDIRGKEDFLMFDIGFRNINRHQSEWYRELDNI
jgi:hypothetical protein